MNSAVHGHPNPVEPQSELKAELINKPVTFSDTVKSQGRFGCPNGCCAVHLALLTIPQLPSSFTIFSPNECLVLNESDSFVWRREQGKLGSLLNRMISNRNLRGGSSNAIADSASLSKTHCRPTQKYIPPSSAVLVSVHRISAFHISKITQHEVGYNMRGDKNGKRILCNLVATISIS